MVGLISKGTYLSLFLGTHSADQNPKSLYSIAKRDQTSEIWDLIIIHVKVEYLRTSTPCEGSMLEVDLLTLSMDMENSRLISLGCYGENPCHSLEWEGYLAGPLP